MFDYLQENMIRCRYEEDKMIYTHDKRKPENNLAEYLIINISS